MSFDTRVGVCRGAVATHLRQCRSDCDARTSCPLLSSGWFGCLLQFAGCRPSRRSSVASLFLV
eukprot:1902644-Prorocentrum_lima.AAC.1